jgi:lipopolysaccharide transport system permease protein
MARSNAKRQQVRRASALMRPFAMLHSTFFIQVAGLRLYQWLWVLLCMVAALVVAAPRVVSQPVVFHATALTHFELGRYGGLYSDGAPNSDFAIALHDTSEALKQRLATGREPGFFEGRRELRFGLPTFTVEFAPLEPGRVQVRGVAPSAAEAKALADAAAAELARQVRAAGGREVLRNLLGWELVRSLRGEPAGGLFQRHLRTIIERDAFPLSRRVEPVSAPISVDLMPADQQNDLARALESRYDLWSFEISARDTWLDATCRSRGLVDRAREDALAACAGANPAARAELDARNRAIDGRSAIEQALRYMLDVQGARFVPDQQDVAFREQAALPAAALPRRIPELLGLAALLGLAFGGFGVAVDRAAGVMPKLRDMWSYRELIRNLVLRDLRARYKGSALGYVWTQLAPLLMMLVFYLVFRVLLRNDIAMFPVFLLVALLPWNYCAEAVAGGARSIVDSAALIKKVYFPREILPLVSVLSSLLSFLLSLPMLLLVMAITQLTFAPLQGQLNFSWTFAFLPVVLTIQTIFLVGLALFFAALAVSFRDTVHLLGILLQFWMFLTPIFYAIEQVAGAQAARLVYWLNPMAALVGFYRDILYGGLAVGGQVPTPSLPALDAVLRTFLTALAALALGYWFFQRRSGRFGEEI